MRFYRLDEVPVSKDDQVFRVSPVGKGIATLVFFGIAIACLAAAISGWKPQGLAPGAWYFFAAVIGLFGLIPLGMFRASLKPSSWLARCTTSGLIIKYRAYENWRLPADSVQAVGFDYGEIAWAKMVKERRTSPRVDGKAGSEITWLTYIDLGLVNPNTTDLEANLQAERNLKPDGMIITMDFPVQVRPGGIVEISWAEGISPRARKAMEILGQRRIKIADVEHRKTDLVHRRDSTCEEDRAKIVALAQSGDEMGAVKLARQVYGYSLSEATEFVDKLVSGSSDERPSA